MLIKSWEVLLFLRKKRMGITVSKVFTSLVTQVCYDYIKKLEGKQVERGKGGLKQHVE
jgi:hypothetical protein